MHKRACAATIAVAMFAAGHAHAQAGATGSGQAYPYKPVRILVTEAGGGIDFAARLIAPALTAGLGQQVIVENRGGASGAIAIETVARAQPDGYTLLLYSNGMWILPLIQKVSFDPVRDFAPITLSDRSPNVLVVNPSLPVKSVPDLIALAKSTPAGLNYASGGAGSATHIGSELFKLMAGIKLTHILYKGSGPAVTALIGGQVHLMFATAGSAASHVKAGRLKALAVASAQPSPLFPDLPTVAASGLPGYESVATRSVFAPARTPASVIRKLNQEIVRVLGLPEVKEKFFSSGVETVGSSPEQLAAAMKAEMATMGKVVREAGIRSD